MAIEFSGLLGGGVAAWAKMRNEERCMWWKVVRGIPGAVGSGKRGARDYAEPPLWQTNSLTRAEAVRCERFPREIAEWQSLKSNVRAVSPSCFPHDSPVTENWRKFLLTQKTRLLLCPLAFRERLERQPDEHEGKSPGASRAFSPSEPMSVGVFKSRASLCRMQCLRSSVGRAHPW